MRMPRERSSSWFRQSFGMGTELPDGTHRHAGRNEDVTNIGDTPERELQPLLAGSGPAAGGEVPVGRQDSGAVSDSG